MHLHENTSRHVRENACCNAAMQNGAGLQPYFHPETVIPGRSLCTN
jgi:hypothetical protein